MASVCSVRILLIQTLTISVCKWKESWKLAVLSIKFISVCGKCRRQFVVFAICPGEWRKWRDRLWSTLNTLFRALEVWSVSLAVPLFVLVPLLLFCLFTRKAPKWRLLLLKGRDFREAVAVNQAAPDLKKPSGIWNVARGLCDCISHLLSASSRLSCCRGPAGSSTHEHPEISEH